MNRPKPQSLTDVELQGLNSNLSLADGHAGQELDAVFEGIFKRMPMYWLEGAGRAHDAAEHEFLQASAQLYASPALATMADFRILPTASLAIDLVAAMAATRGDRVALIHPAFDNLALILNRRHVNTCAVDDDSLIRAIREEALPELLGPLDINCLFVVNPNNPTGRVLSKADLVAIVSYCKRCGITLLLDNSFRLYNRTPFDDYQVLLDSGVSFVAIEDTGKVLPTQEKKASLLACSANLAPLIDEIFHEIYLTTCGPDLRMLSEFLRQTAEHGPDMVLWRTVDARRARLRRAIAGTPLRVDRRAVHSPLSVEWLDCSRTGLADEELCARLQARGLTILPGRQFFWDQPNNRANHHNVRVSLLKPKAVFAAGVEVLSDFARSLQEA